MKSAKIKLIYIALSMAITGCYSQKKLANLNPTSYVFDTDIEQCKNAIKKVKILDVSRPYFIDKKESHRDYIYIYNDSANRNDAILTCIGNFDSKIYFRFGFPYPYWADFHVHLDSILENKTRVEIFTLEPKIVVFGVGIGHVSWTWTKKVPPSTIEEYEILLSIGEQLGEKNMPACNYPKRYLKYCIRKDKRGDSCFPCPLQ